MVRGRKINTISKRQCTISTIIINGVLKHKYSNNINIQLKKLYPLYEKYSLDETYEKLLTIYDICPICGYKIYYFQNPKCLNIGTIPNENDQEYHDKIFKVYSEICYKNVHYMIDTLLDLWENDPEWAENQRKICAKNGKENGLKNLEAYNEYLDQHPEIRQEIINKAKKI